MPLTSRQKEELYVESTILISHSHKEILDYLKVSGFTATAEAFQKETEVEDLDPKKSGALEKKVTSVVRLQKKVTPKRTRV